MKIILPKTLPDIDPAYGPFFFIAGPVAGGDDWQAVCCEEIRKHIPNFYAALPCWYEETHPLMPFRVTGGEDYFDRQLTWERHYLEIAATTGCIIFWLPCESRTAPRNDGHPYAMDTRGELGEWRGRLMHNPNLRVVIGAESDFPGLSQIQRNFDFATGSHFPIYSTLTETVTAAIGKVWAQVLNPAP